MLSAGYALEVYKRTTRFLEDFANKHIYTKHYIKWDDVGGGLLSPQEKFKLIYDINKRYRYFLEVNNEGPEYFTVQITDMGKTIEDIKYELVYKIAKNIFNIVKYRNDGETIKLEWADIIDTPVSDDIAYIVKKGMEKYGIKIVYYNSDGIEFINNSDVVKNQLLGIEDDTNSDSHYVIPKPNTALILESKEDKDNKASEEPEIKLRSDGVAETIVKITR